MTTRLYRSENFFGYLFLSDAVANQPSLAASAIAPMIRSSLALFDGWAKVFLLPIRQADDSKRVSMIFLPFNQNRQHAFYLPSVANEIIIDNEDRFSPTRIIERLEFFFHLIRSFAARGSAIHNDDIAKLAVIRTPPGILN